MNVGIIIGIVVGLLLLLGGLLFISAQFVIRRMGKQNKTAGGRKVRLWVWRGFIFVLLVYSALLIAVNKDILYSLAPGPFSVILTIFLVVYFVALVELVVIDLLLPDIIAMWKRITIEVLVFILLCSLTVFILNISLSMLSNFA